MGYRVGLPRERMKSLPLVGLGLAGIALAIVALRAPPRDYVAPTVREVEAHRAAPQTLRGQVPDGCVVRAIQVKGMCCAGCTGRLYERLVGTAGTVDAAVNLETGVAQIVIPKDADPAPWVAALRFDDFEPQLVP